MLTKATDILAHHIKEALACLYKLRVELPSVKLLQTKKEFEGDFSLVTLPLIFLFMLTLNTPVFCQVKPVPVKIQAYADLGHAMEIQDSIAGPLNVSLGHGKIQDNELETNSAWFKFTMPKDTILTFDIVGLDSCDDYEFELYKYSGLDFADKIRRKLLKPLRSRKWPGASVKCVPSTGLSLVVTDSVTDNTKKKARYYYYLPALPVKKGETYYLMVNYSSILPNSTEAIEMKMNNAHLQSPSGFMIYFYNYWPKKKDKKAVKDILFESNQATLSKSAYAQLDELVKELLKNKTQLIEIKGHADNTGTEKDNIKLSKMRAKSVYDYLLSKGIDKKRMTYSGAGSSSPLSSKTAEDKAKNRRVEILLK